MLVLSRKCGQTVRIGQDITITFLKISRHVAKIGIEAPSLVSILRGELGGGGGSAASVDNRARAIRFPLRLSANLQPLIGIGRYQC